MSLAIYFGRFISVLYGVASIVLTYLFAKEVFNDKKTALVSALFIGLAGLHVTHSHLATADIMVTFWIYAALYTSLLFMKRGNPYYLLLSSIFTGFSLRTKYMFITLLPLVYFFVKSREKAFYSILIATGVVAGFSIINGFAYTYMNFYDYLSVFFFSNEPATMAYGAQQNILSSGTVYLASLVPGIGLPVFFLAIYGIYKSYPRLDKLQIPKWKTILIIILCVLWLWFMQGLPKLLILWGVLCAFLWIKYREYLQKNEWLVLVVPIVMHFTSVCSLGFLGIRHILPELPFLAMLAAYGFSQIKKHATPILALIVVYQIISVASIEYYFISDTRGPVGEWLVAEVRLNETIAVSPYSEVPRGLKTVWLTENNLYNTPLNQKGLNESRFLVLHERYYYRCFRSSHSPLGDPDPRNLFHANPATCQFIQSLFRGNEPYVRVNKAEVEPIVPEMVLYKMWIGTYPDWVGDTVVYRKVGE